MLYYEDMMKKEKESVQLKDRDSQNQKWERRLDPHRVNWKELIKDLELKAQSLGRVNPCLEPLKKYLRSEGLL